MPNRMSDNNGWGGMDCQPNYNWRRYCTVNWDLHRYTTMTQADFLELCAQDGVNSMSDADIIRRNYDIKLKEENNV